MKKIIVTILSLITLLSVGSMSAFAVLEDDNVCTKSVPKKRMSEETKNKIREEFTKLKGQRPDLSNSKIYEILSKDFNTSISTAKRYSLQPEDYEGYKEYYRQYYHKKNKKNLKKYYEENKEKFKQHYKDNQEKQKEYFKQYYRNNKERAKKEKEEWDKKLNEIQNLKKFGVGL